MYLDDGVRIMRMDTSPGYVPFGVSDRRSLRSAERTYQFNARKGARSKVWKNIIASIVNPRSIPEKMDVLDFKTRMQI